MTQQMTSTAITYIIIQKFEYKSVNIKQTPRSRFRLRKRLWWWHLSQHGSKVNDAYTETLEIKVSLK